MKNLMEDNAQKQVNACSVHGKPTLAAAIPSLDAITALAKDYGGSRSASTVTLPTASVNEGRSFRVVSFSTASTRSDGPFLALYARDRLI